jgi:hypothetical protein
VEALPIAAQDELGHILSAVETAMQSGVSHGRRTTAAAYQRIWAGFCQQYNLEPDLRTSPDPIPWLQIFADSVRTCLISASGHSVRSGNVADAVCFVAQMFTLLGKCDHLFTQLARQLKGYSKCDAPPSRVKPILLAVLPAPTQLYCNALSSASPFPHKKMAPAAKRMGMAVSAMPLPGTTDYFPLRCRPCFYPYFTYPDHRLLRAAVLSNPTPSGLLPSDINAKSLRATGAMALINRNVDLDRLRLIGRWKSDAVLRYLHFQAHDIMSDYSSLMIAGSNFCLIPTMPDASLPTFH